MNISLSVLKGALEKSNPSLLVTVIYGVISSVGIIGNSLVCLVVIKNRSMRASAQNILITNLALDNLIASITLIPFVRLPQIDNSWKYGAAMCTFFNAFNGTNVYCSAFTIMAIATDRYFAVTSSRPRRGTLCGLSALWVSLGIWIASILLAVPPMLYYTETQVTMDIRDLEERNITILDKGNETELLLRTSCAFVPPSFGVKVTTTVLQTFFLLPIPLFTIAMFNFALLRFLAKHQQISRNFRQSRHNNGNKGSIANTQRDNLRVNILLLAMAFAYGILWLPFNVLTLLYDFFQGFIERQGIEIQTWDMRFLCVAYASLCINPFLYGFFNKNFSKEFKKLLPKACRRRNNSHQTHDGASDENQSMLLKSAIRSNIHHN